jgi:transposase
MQERHTALVRGIRRTAVQLMEQRKSIDRIVETLGVSRASVYEWQRKYREGGLSATVHKVRRDLACIAAWRDDHPGSRNFQFH